MFLKRVKSGADHPLYSRISSAAAASWYPYNPARNPAFESPFITTREDAQAFNICIAFPAVNGNARNPISQGVLVCCGVIPGEWHKCFTTGKDVPATDRVLWIGHIAQRGKGICHETVLSRFPRLRSGLHLYTHPVKVTLRVEYAWVNNGESENVASAAGEQQHACLNESE